MRVFCATILNRSILVPGRDKWLESKILNQNKASRKFQINQVYPHFQSFAPSLLVIKCTNLALYCQEKHQTWLIIFSAICYIENLDQEAKSAVHPPASRRMGEILSFKNNFAHPAASRCGRWTAGFASRTCQVRRLFPPISNRWLFPPKKYK